MFKRLLGGGLAVAIAVLGLSASAAQAKPARTARPATALPGLHVQNLHAAYTRALPTARSGKPSGIVYAIGHAPKAARAAGTAGASGCTEPNCNLVYHGGPVQHDPKIYLLLWGPKWTTDSTQAATAAYLESFLQGLGTQPQDNWSTITAQYTDSTGFPGFHGSEYIGMYQDTTTPPSGTTLAQFTAEADAFATAHGLTGDVNAQIVIATQSGTCPSGFGSGGICPSGGQYCAWHTNSVNTGVTFTNLPYLLDANDCGQNFVNSNSQGLYDGFSIVEGHEYAETITDPVPGTGWIDTADKYGGEIGDKCAWGGSIWGGNDPYGDVTLSTGSFAMQSLWNNAAGACTMSPTTDTLTVTGPGSQTMTVGAPVSLQIKASSSTGAKLEYYAAGLPAGLSIDAATGLITGKPTATGTGSATITADDTTGAVRSATFTWTVNQAPDTVAVTSPGNQTTTAGQSVSLQIKASSSTGATLTYQAAGLPTGLAIDTATGLITGTPNTPGSGSVTLTVTDTTGGQGTATFTWTVNPAPDSVTVTSPGNQTTTFGQSVSLQIKASSSTGATLTYQAAGLPAGLSIDPSTGLITGTPSSPGTGPVNVTVTVTDTTGAHGTATFTWTVNPAPDTVTVTKPPTQTTTVGTTVSLQIQATSSTGATLTYQAAGLPVGLSIDPATGLITGKPTTPGSGSVTLTVTDTTGGQGTATFTWTVNPAPPPPPSTFRIKGYKSECVTDDGYLSAPGTRAVINPCNNLLREKWTTGTGNSLKINGLCLTDPGWGRWGTKLVLEPCTGWKNQNWTLKANGEYTIAVHGLCLTDPRWSTKSGTQLIIQSCRDWANQRWTKA